MATWSSTQDRRSFSISDLRTSPSIRESHVSEQQIGFISSTNPRSASSHTRRASQASASTDSTSTHSFRSPFLRTSSVSIRYKEKLGFGRSNSSASAASSSFNLPEEFDTLPAPIQQKYFSSVERLRTMQESANIKRKRLPGKLQWPNFASSTDLSLPASPRPALESRRKSISGNSKPSIRRLSEVVSDEDALLFISLPEKIRRQQFSREEHALLTARSAALEQAYSSLATIDKDDDHEREVSPPLDTPQQQPGFSSRPELSPLSATFGQDDDLLEEETRTRLDSATCLPQDIEDEDKDDVVVCPDISRTKSDVTKPNQSRPVNWLKLLVPIPLPPPTLAPVPTKSLLTLRPSTPKSPNFSRLRTVSTEKFHFERPAPVPAPVIPTPEAAYYHDADVRRKLRNYLVSAENFDESVEFGFPTMSESDLGGSTTSSSSRCRDSFQSDEDDDNKSFESHGPLTPIIADTNAARPSKGVSAPYPVLFPENDGRFASSPADRQMTIRMTLTRPELQHALSSTARAESTPDTPTSPCRSASAIMAVHDPLALESLPVCDDPTGMHGAFAVKQKKQKHGKVFKSLRVR